MDDIDTNLDQKSSNELKSDDSSLQDKVCNIVAEVLGLHTGVTPEQTFESLGADSIDMATLIVTLQDEFPTTSALDESAFVNIKTPEDISEFIRAQI